MNRKLPSKDTGFVDLRLTTERASLAMASRIVADPKVLHNWLWRSVVELLNVVAAAFQLTNDSFDRGGGVPQNVCLPEPQNCPASPLQPCSLAIVPRAIGRNLQEPVVRIPTLRESCAESRPVPAMPEVAIAEDTQPFRAKHDVRSSG